MKYMMKSEELFTIRRAEAADLDSVMTLMNATKAGMEHPDWYVTDERPWVERHLEQEGFIMVAESRKKELAGYFIVDFPARRGSGEEASGDCAGEQPGGNLGTEIHLNPQQLKLVAHMDSAAVSPEFRGHHLQSMLVEASERELEARPEQYLLCTIHPENHASLHTMQRHGYVIVATREKYGGLRRYVLYKKKESCQNKDSGKHKPCVLVSACLLGVNCRYNDKGVLEPEVRALMDRFQVIPVCPEILGGLATPRDPAERIGDRVMTRTGMDVTKQYRRGAEETLKLAKLYGCSCAVLKERSPSCGSGIIYDGTFTGARIPGDGVTAELLKANGIQVFGESQASALETCSEKENKDSVDGRDIL